MGKRGPKVDKPWGDALRLAVHREMEDGRKYLAAIAEQCVQAAASGDMSAIKEIGDRLDGRPHQSVDAALTHDVADPLAALLGQIAEQRRRVTDRD